MVAVHAPAKAVSDSVPAIEVRKESGPGIVLLPDALRNLEISVHVKLNYTH